MFKKAAAILFISTCLLMQYAMQFAYLQCKVENSISTLPACDCEKKYGNDAGNNGAEIPLQKNHNHLTIDAFVLPAEHIMNDMPAGISPDFADRDFTFRSICNGSIFRPPQC